MRSVTAIEASWLVELVPHAFKFDVLKEEDIQMGNKSSSTRLVGNGLNNKRNMNEVKKPMKKKNFMVD